MIVVHVMLMFCFNFCQVGRNRVGRNWVDVNFLKLSFRIFEPIFFNFQNFLHPVFLERLLRSFFSLIYSSCHSALLSEKSDIPTTKSKILNPLCPAPCGPLPPMVPGGFIPMSSLLLCPILPLHTSGLLYRLIRNTLWSPCPHPLIVVVAWWEWMTGGSVFVLSKRNPILLMECNPLIAIISGDEGWVMSGSKAVFISTQLAWAAWFIANLSN